MNKILINIEEDLATTLLVRDGDIVEIIKDCTASPALSGNIYAGVVKNIMPSRFAFIDIGLEKNAFLFLSDKREEALFFDESKKPKLRAGDSIVVQVVKEPTGNKGPCVTGRLSFQGRFAVLNTGGLSGGMGFSQKITNHGERERLKKIYSGQTYNHSDMIVRTEAEGKEESLLLNDLNRLNTLAEMAESQWPNVKGPKLLHSEGDPLFKTLKDIFRGDIDQVIVNDIEKMESLRENLTPIYPEAAGRFSFFEGSGLFQSHGLSSQLAKAENQRGWLKSGGYILIEKTEALYVIDVNSGKFSGKKNHEESMKRINLEAAEEIARQIRLRNLSGIIIVDFIDMTQDANKSELMSFFAGELKKDRLPTVLVGMTELGLVQITRKRVRNSLME